MKLIGVGRVPPVVRQVGLGVAFWLAFLVVLEPGNVMRALRTGGGPSWSQEIIRIACACLLGASTAPLLFTLGRRFPIRGRVWPRNSAIQGLCCFAFSALLIVISCVIAALVLTSERRPFLVALGVEFTSNWLLLSFCLAAFSAIVQAVIFFRQLQELETSIVTKAGAAGFAAQIEVRARGRTTFLELDKVDWVEAQGNYLALHVGPTSHLIRDSLAHLESRLDPMRFTRIHRGIIVAVDRIQAMKSLGAGDASVSLKDGTELRMSRNFRESLLTAMRQEA